MATEEPKPATEGAQEATGPAASRPDPDKPDPKLQSIVERGADEADPRLWSILEKAQKPEAREHIESSVEDD